MRIRENKGDLAWISNGDSARLYPSFESESATETASVTESKATTESKAAAEAASASESEASIPFESVP